ncbi:hypothetical protein PAXINDRAFT_104093 [Paxillus involutus ATCC 200175]|uniref:Band 7 domain-containing protein n=1 Tax=Paxillus involutus ATCC 200175 TaxID=664439 RepID=A0A0C9T8Q5_PAXIN|nr:hypothetical protein PAXINDRAFT_104093 [Paxillus involutus ATCC 200175]
MSFKLIRNSSPSLTNVSHLVSVSSCLLAAQTSSSVTAKLDRRRSLARAQQRHIVTIVPQGHEAYRLTLGRNPERLHPGLHINIPLLHTLQLVDTRETSIPISDLNGFTSDNVPVLVSGSLFFRVQNAYDACFSVNNFNENVKQIGTSAMRSVVGSFYYDAIISDRNGINDKLRNVIGNSIQSWGIECTRFEIQTFKPSNREVERQLELQMEVMKHLPTLAGGR